MKRNKVNSCPYCGSDDQLVDRKQKVVRIGNTAFKLARSIVTCNDCGVQRLFKEKGEKSAELVKVGVYNV